MKKIENNEMYEEVAEKWWFWGLMGEMCTVLLALAHRYQYFDLNIDEMLVSGSKIRQN